MKLATLANTEEAGRTMWGKAIWRITCSRPRTEVVAEASAAVNHFQGRMAAPRKRRIAG
jgi:hypothetical protein